MNAGGVPKTCKSSAQLIVFVALTVLSETGRGDFPNENQPLPLKKDELSKR